MARKQVDQLNIRSGAEPAGRLVRKGRLWVMPASGNTITLAEANAALDEARLEREQQLLNPS